MPAAYPVGKVSHWPQSGGLQFQKALVPHLKKKDPTPSNVPIRKEPKRRSPWLGHAPPIVNRPTSHLSLRRFIIPYLCDDLCAAQHQSQNLTHPISLINVSPKNKETEAQGAILKAKETQNSNLEALTLEKKSRNRLRFIN